ncbi:MAG: aconitate hydratase AcnA, partial [Candidatus Thermoplasmatota archaeon]|nr:aconitate hydratase AcnA [Candidatus Thermoplasmatota archaeon]
MTESDLRIIREIQVGKKKYRYFSLPELENLGYKVSRMPRTIRIILESMIRNMDAGSISEESIKLLLQGSTQKGEEISFKVSRVLMQDFTGVPAIVDLASMREKFSHMGMDPVQINPVVPVDLVIDHSVQVDYFGSDSSYSENLKMEFNRNMERYRFLKWASRSFRNLRVIPPSVGIVHQVNLEYLSDIVSVRKLKDEEYALFDTLVGTDSHTTMVNGIGVLGWGVGGIEAEAAMLGEPITIALPEVVGVNLHGKLRPGITATDLVLTLTSILRKANVVGKILEFYGDGLSELSAADRATVSNMCPEYGATAALFPVDDKTVEYMRLTGKSAEKIELVVSYMKAQGLYGSTSGIEYGSLVDVDLSSIEASVSGPKLPQQQMPISRIGDSFMKFMEDQGRSGNGKTVTVSLRSVPVRINGVEDHLTEGDVVIAAITSCTNTSNPKVMVAAGLLAKKAHELGLKANPKVKASLAPGSRVVTDYLNRSGLMKYLENMGFYLVGYGCTTCIGNSGPLPEPIQKAIQENDLNVAAVLSGNRNFEARIHRDVHANYLMSPPLVVAFAIAGRVTVDLTKEPLGVARDGKKIFLRDIWPTNDEIEKVISEATNEDDYRRRYSNIDHSSELW